MRKWMPIATAFLGLGLAAVATAKPPTESAGWDHLAGQWERYAESEAKDEAAKEELLKGGEASLEVLLDLLFEPRSDQKVETLVEQLGAAQFEIREAATRELKALGGRVVLQLKRHQSHPDPEVRARVARIVEARDSDRKRIPMERMETAATKVLEEDWPLDEIRAVAAFKGFGADRRGPSAANSQGRSDTGKETADRGYPGPVGSSNASSRRRLASRSRGGCP